MFSLLALILILSFIFSILLYGEYKKNMYDENYLNFFEKLMKTNTKRLKKIHKKNLDFLKE